MLEEADRGRRQALLEAAERLGQFGSWEWIPDADEHQWSDNMFRIFGLEPGEIEPTLDYVINRIHPEDRERVAGAIDELRAETGGPPGLEYRILTPEGVRHVRGMVAVTEWEGDKPARLIGSIHDLTDERRAEREIAAHWAVSEALTEWQSLHAGARALLANLADAMDFAAGAFWLPLGDVLEAHVVWHDALAELRDFEATTLTARLPRGIGVPGRAWERRQPISVASVADAGSARDAVAAREGLRGAVAIPALATGDEVLAVVELASREEGALTERLMRSLVGIAHELGHFLDRRRGELETPVLSPREVEVLQLAANGLSARGSAERLFLSPATVRTHLENIYTKLGVSDKASAVARALRLGLIE